MPLASDRSTIGNHLDRIQLAWSAAGWSAR